MFVSEEYIQIFYLQLELWPPNIVSSPYLALPVCFLNWFWSFWIWYNCCHLKGCQPLCPGTPPQLDEGWRSLSLPSAQLPRQPLFPNCSNTLPTSCNEMLNRFELEKQLDFTH